jgi:hypothetical protein
MATKMSTSMIRKSDKENETQGHHCLGAKLRQSLLLLKTTKIKYFP